MKLIDAELVMMKGDDATEAERLDCAKYWRQQVRSCLTQSKSVAMMLSVPTARQDQYRVRGDQLRIMHQEAEVDLESTIQLIGQLREEFPALTADWDDCERRANAMHQALRTSDNKIRPPAAGS